MEIEKINVDSLERILHELNGAERIDALNKLSFALSSANFDRSKSLSNQTIELSRQLDYQKGLADGYFNLGNIYLFTDSLKPMVLNHLNALRIYEQIDPCLEMLLVLRQLSRTNRLLGRYAKAKEYDRKAIQTAQVLSDRKYEIMSLMAYGDLCAYNQEYDSAFYYADVATELLKIYPDDSSQGSLTFMYGWIYARKYFNEKGKGVESLEDLNMAISWHIKSNEFDKVLLAKIN